MNKEVYLGEVLNYLNRLAESYEKNKRLGRIEHNLIRTELKSSEILSHN